MIYVRVVEKARDESLRDRDGLRPSESRITRGEGGE